MSNEKQFDVVVIGGGPGGYIAAIRAATSTLMGRLQTIQGIPITSMVI